MENEAYLINGGKIKLAWRIQFNLTGISDKAKMEHIFPYISSGAIVSLQNLCNCGFMAGEGGGGIELKKTECRHTRKQKPRNSLMGDIT